MTHSVSRLCVLGLVKNDVMDDPYEMTHTQRYVLFVIPAVRTVVEQSANFIKYIFM
jgi:hypothetical protein